MATNILMPALSPTMTEGTLSRWLKKEGENVQAGDVIAEIETDKATMEVEAVDEGVLGKILVQDGTEGVKVNEPIAVLVEQGEAVPARAPAAKRRAPSQPAGAPGSRRSAAARSRRRAPKRRRRPRRRAAMGTMRAATASSPRRSRAGWRSRPGIDLAALKGSGPNGRIVKADIEAALQKGAPAAPAGRCPARTGAGAPGAAPAITAPHKLVPHSSIRKVIARRLTEAKSTIPHFYVSMDVEIDALIKLMNELNAKSPKEGPGAYLITINDLVIKAAAATLRRMPDGQRRLDRRRDGAVRRRRYQRRGRDPGRADHADRSQARTRRAWRRSAAK